MADVVEVDVRVLESLAIEASALHVDVLVGVVLCHDGEGLASAHVHGSLVEERRTDNEATANGVYLVETYRREDVPSRHLTYVLVARESVGLVEIHLVEHLAQHRSSLIGASCVVVHIYNMVARLVAVSILTSHTRHIRRSVVASPAFNEEERVELRHECLV